MRKLLLVFGAGLVLTACGGEKSEYEKYYDKDYKPEVATAPQTQPEAVPEEVSEFAVGKKLIASSDCKTCHQDEKRIVGPSYIEVAKKYEFNDKNLDYLAQKIIQGGKGVWGEIPMISHPDLSEADAKEMARYVLSLNQEN